jgi:hypothetical protein
VRAQKDPSSQSQWVWTKVRQPLSNIRSFACYVREVGSIPDEQRLWSMHHHLALFKKMQMSKGEKKYIIGIQLTCLWRFDCSYLPRGPRDPLTFSEVNNARIELAQRSGRKDFALYEEALDYHPCASQPRAVAGRRLLEEVYEEVSPTSSTAETLVRSPWDLNSSGGSFDDSYCIWGKSDSFDKVPSPKSIDLFGPYRTDIFMVRFNLLTALG